MGKLFSLKIEGDLACFTRPEHKIERLSYPLMTPSAARGVLDSIYWKPEMRWQVREVWVLRPIRYVTFMRNEIMHAASGGPVTVEGQRQQRLTTCLRDVAYVVRAEIACDSDWAKHASMFERRVAKGQQYRQPYLGLREFIGYVEPVSGEERPIEVTMDLGLMLYEPDYSGKGAARYFPAQLQKGVMHVH